MFGLDFSARTINPERHKSKHASSSVTDTVEEVSIQPEQNAILILLYIECSVARDTATASTASGSYRSSH